MKKGHAFALAFMIILIFAWVVLAFPVDRFEPLFTHIATWLGLVALVAGAIGILVTGIKE